MEIDEKTLSEVIARIVEATLKAEGCSNLKTSTDEFGTVKEVAPSGVTKIDYKHQAAGIRLQWRSSGRCIHG